jgi:competence protein ComEC
VDRFTVWRYGATAIWLDRHHARIVTDRAYRGARPWVPAPPVPRSHPMPALPPAKTDKEATAE